MFGFKNKLERIKESIDSCVNEIFDFLVYDPELKMKLDEEDTYAIRNYIIGDYLYHWDEKFMDNLNYNEKVYKTFNPKDSSTFLPIYKKELFEAYSQIKKVSIENRDTYENDNSAVLLITEYLDKKYHNGDHYLSWKLVEKTGTYSSQVGEMPAKKYIQQLVDQLRYNKI